MTRRALFAALIVLGAGAGATADPLIPNDPFYVSHQWYGSVLGLPEAWPYGLGSADVIIAVLDTGVMADTPDLAGRLLAPLSSTGNPPMDGTANHHGTWVASSVGMGVGNGIGGAGVGNFTILPITVTNAAGANASYDLAQGIRMAADAGARVINVSLSTLTYGQVNDAAEYARGKGALTFVAAGNSNAYNPLTDYEYLIFVSGTDRNDQRWDGGTVGSSWGPYVDLAAPAVDILVADPHNANLPSGYGIHYGTSYAAPLAGGAAAMAWSICPDLTPEEVLGLLTSTAVDLGDPGWDEVFGHGRVDVGAVAAGAWALTPEPATLALVAGGLAVLAVRRRVRAGCGSSR